MNNQLTQRKMFNRLVCIFQTNKTTFAANGFLFEHNFYSCTTKDTTKKWTTHDNNEMVIVFALAHCIGCCLFGSVPFHFSFSLGYCQKLFGLAYYSSFSETRINCFMSSCFVMLHIMRIALVRCAVTFLNVRMRLFALISWRWIVSTKKWDKSFYRVTGKEQPKIF